MSNRELLYNLLPAIYRIRDATAHTVGGKSRSDQLRALLGVLEEQLDCLEFDIAGLHEDWFIETCSEWVVPYIGELLGVRLLHNIESSGVYSQRALVANTLGYRRRKGTLLVLEDLARDVTGWRARAVEFFELLGWTQNLNHLRYDVAANPDPQRPDVLNPHSVNRVGTVNLRSLDVVDRIGGPFDSMTHTVDVRPVGQLDGWHNIRNLGIFLWRLQSYPWIAVQPQRSVDYADGYHFSPLGNPAPLFTNPEPKAGEKGAATELNVPGAIRPVAFFHDLEAYYGAASHKSLAIYEGALAEPDKMIPADAVMCKDLSSWSPPPAGKVAIDVELGRLAFAVGETPVDGVTVTFHYGFSADVGGGPYDRRDSLEAAGTGDRAIYIAKVRPAEVDVAEYASSISAAIAMAQAGAEERLVLTIHDNGTYEEDIDLVLASEQHLIIQADDRNRPTLRLVDNTGATDVLTVTGGTGTLSSLTLSGLLIEGGITVDAESLGELEIRHCTLVPGRALDELGLPVSPAASSLSVDADNVELEITIEWSIVGALRVPQDVKHLTVRDSIVDRPEENAVPQPPRVAIAQNDDGSESGPSTTLERVTVLGDVVVETLDLASEILFLGVVTVTRKQQGCVRYSYVDDTVSTTPRRFRCQPDLELATERKRQDVKVLPIADAELIRARVLPAFKTDSYGDPAYAQLHWNVATEILTGAEDGAEMGVFEHLKQPQREANLRARMEEYMPYGLQFGLVYVT